MSTKSKCLFLALMMLIQGCRVYKKETMTLEDASAANVAIKLKKNNGEEMTFTRIEKIDGEFFGIQESSQKIVQVPLKEEDIKELRLHNKAMSSVLGLGLGIIGTLTVIFVSEARKIDIKFGSPN